MTRRALALVALAALAGGCVDPVNPDPSLRHAATGVELLPLAANGAFGATLEVAWRTHNPTGAAIDGTWIAFGPVSRPDGRNLTVLSYPFRLEAPSAGPDGTRAALLTLNFSTVHVRAYAAIGALEWWSPETAIEVAGVPFGDPEVRLDVPPVAEAGVPFLARWSVRNATGGLAELTALPGRPSEPTRPLGAFRFSPALNGTSGNFSRDLTLPFPGTWTVLAALNLSGSVLLANASEVRVREPGSPNVAFIAPPRDADPGERVLLRFRANGPGAIGDGDVVAGTEAIAAQRLGPRNFSAAVFAPTSGTLAARARVIVDGAPVESAPLIIPVTPQGPWTVTLVNHPTEAAAGAPIGIAFRVTGPAANASFAGAHSGNRSVQAAPASLAPGNYTAATGLADGAGASGGWAVPAALHVNLTAPREAGVLWFRARIQISGASYWSEEGSVLVRA